MLDSSVAFKWYLPSDEPQADEAFQLLTWHADGEFEFAVPDLFWAEFGNTCWNAVRRGRCARTVVEGALADIRERRLHTFPSFDLLPEAFVVAVT